MTAFGERVHWIDMYKSLNGIIPNNQTSWFISQLCTWSFNLRHQQHLKDGKLCHILKISSHEISKCHILDTTCSPQRFLCGQDRDCLPLVFEQIDSMNEM